MYLFLLRINKIVSLNNSLKKKGLTNKILNISIVYTILFSSLILVKMSSIANYKIKKSKLLFRLPLQTNPPYSDISDKQQKVCQLTFRSIRNSNSKFKTVNYKKYDEERKLQMELRKKAERPLSLYLDGANSPFQSTIIQSTLKPTISHKRPQYISQIQQSSQSLQPKQSQTRNILSPSRKALKKMILKQIQIKTHSKSKNTAHRLCHVDSLPFETVEQLIVLKKLNKDRKLQTTNQTNIMVKPTFMSEQLAHSEKVHTKLPSKHSVFSERNFTQKKSKSQLKPQNQFSCVVLPSVEDKSNSRPQVFLQGNEAKKILSEHYIVLKYPQGKIVSGVGYKKNVQIASLTKIMTFYTILSICQEYSIDYKKRVVQICERAEEMTGTSAEILSGEKYTLENLFYGMMLPSGNDAAVAIANEGGMILKQNKNKRINSDEENVKCFVRYMNLIAKNIGMKTSTFSNPHGLSDPHNLSNAYEMALLVSECMKFQEFSKVTGTKTYNFWTEGQKSKRKQIIWQNTHKLLRRPGFIGGKTGVTVTAGPCLATIYRSRAGQTFIVVVLRASKLSRRFKQTRWILGLTLKKLDAIKYATEAKQILKSNPELDSDNSEDEEMFDFKKADSAEMRKRTKILVYEM